MKVFLDAAKSAARKSPKGSAKRVVFKYLLKHAVGSKNAKTWNELKKEFRRHGVAVNKRKFQQGILNDSRKNSIFIGSNSRGYFLIQNRDDAMAMYGFYVRRVSAEWEKMQKLETLMRKLSQQ
jgi:hypothetical protein